MFWRTAPDEHLAAKRSRMTDIATKTRAVLLDIEGTTTPIAFVHDVLFPFARDHVREYLNQHSKSSEVQEDIAALLREHSVDQERGEQPPQIDKVSSVSYTHL